MWGWIWSCGWWSSRYHSIKLILIIEGSHYDPIRHEDGLSGIGCLELSKDSWIIDTGTHLISSAGLSCVSMQWLTVSMHAHFNASDLYMENMTWIDHNQTHFHSIAATDKWDHWGRKLDYPTYFWVFSPFSLKCAVLANSRLGTSVQKKKKYSLCLRIC